MGREVRRVPVGWKHPTAPNPYWVQHYRGRPTPKLHPINEAFVPLLDGPFSEKLEEWRTEKLEWDAGTHKSQEDCPYEEYYGPEPDPADYVPEWDVPAEELGYCLYETVSEGTPVTPVFATPEELIEHLVTAGQDWDQEPMRREAAEALVRSGWGPTAIVVSNASGTTFLKGDMDADKIEQLRKDA